MTKGTKSTLGVESILPVDLEDPMIRGALEQARRALSNPRLRAILEVRTTIQQVLCNHLVEEGYLHPPVYMLAGCTDPLNHWTYPARVSYYGEEVSVTQSLILQKLLMVMLSPTDKVFWASPNIRMEMRIGRKEYKYCSEFMQVDWEKRNGTYEEMINLVSDMTRRLHQELRDRHGSVIEEIRGTPLPELKEKLPVFDAQEVKRDHNLVDDDEVERWGSDRSDGKPFIVVNLKREAYDHQDRDSGRFLNYDIVYPPHGKNPHPVECLSGAERTRSLGDLKKRMQELGYPMSYFAPFFELFRSMSPNSNAISCAGAGFGVERLVFSCLGLKDIHEVYPFPRMAEAKIAI